MNYSVKSIGFFGLTNLNSSDKNSACQPIRSDVSSHKVRFGNCRSQECDSFSKSDKLNQNLPLSLGQRFENAAKTVAKKLNGKNVSGSDIAAELSKEVYGVAVN